MHTCEWDKAQEIDELFVLEKKQCPLVDAQVAPNSVDLIYYDAFGPRVQPELWTKAIFDLLFTWLVPEGILVTYCAKGQVKRDLKAAGFIVENLPGPPGKREMTRAIKPKTCD
jgi:tRNA U34 5-methylaminomethyl-2-thiouridine-forming methyltransferase MnmC